MVTTKSQNSDSNTISSDIYSVIRQDIIGGKFEPGEKLRIEVMRKLYQVGNSPLREALTRLAATGLIHQENQRGFRIPPISREDLQDICSTRIRLEVAALELAISQGDDQWEAHVLGAYHRLKKAQQSEQAGSHAWERRHSEFHNALIEACESPSLIRFCQILHDQFDRYRRLAPNDLSIRDELDQQHQKIMELALERDGKQAGELLAVHIQLSARSALAAC